MRLLFLIFVFALFTVPSVYFEYASRSTQSSVPSQEIAKKDSAESSQTSTSTVQKKAAETPALKALAKKSVAAAAATADSTPKSTPGPTATSEATSTPVQTPTKLVPQNPQADFAAQIEAEILRLTNNERVKAGLPALAGDARLRNIAWGHSADMLANNYFAHEDQKGCSSSCRSTNAGYLWQSIGENIYMMSGYELPADATAKMVVDGWMDSPGHRKNILGTSFTVSGVGVIDNGMSVYVTALYANPR